MADDIARSQAIVLYKEALDAYINGPITKAIALWKASLIADPTYEESLIRLGYALEEQGYILKEIEESQEAVAQKDAEAIYRLAANKRSLGEDAAAIAAWEQVTKIDNGNWAKSARKMLRKHYGISTDWDVKPAWH